MYWQSLIGPIEAAEAPLAAHPVAPSLTDAQMQRMAAAAGGT